MYMMKALVTKLMAKDPSKHEHARKTTQQYNAYISMVHYIHTCRYPTPHTKIRPVKRAISVASDMVEIYNLALASLIHFFRIR